VDVESERKSLDEKSIGVTPDVVCMVDGNDRFLSEDFRARRLSAEVMDSSSVGIFGLL